MYRGEQTHVQIDPGIFSDHSFVVAEIDARKTVRGPGIWRFNNSLLEDDNFKCAVREEIGRCIKRDTPYNGEISIGVVVEMLLSNCRVIAMRRNTEIKRQQRKEEEELTETLIILELNLSAEDPSTIQAYDEAKNILEQIKQRKGELAILASGARWIEQGEKPSKYFLNLAKKRSGQKSIAALKTADGRLLSDRKEILTRCAEFFRNLFRSRGIDCEKMNAFDLDEGEPRLSEEDKMLCESPITIGECYDAVKGMAKNKAPGVTGFTS